MRDPDINLESGDIRVYRDGDHVEIDICGQITLAIPDATAHDLGKILVETAGLED